MESNGQRNPQGRIERKYHEVPRTLGWAEAGSAEVGYYGDQHPANMRCPGRECLFADIEAEYVDGPAGLFFLAAGGRNKQEPKVNNKIYIYERRYFEQIN
jgi:hypothetical protein